MMGGDMTFLAGALVLAAAAAPIEVASPNGKLVLKVSAGDKGRLGYEITFGGQPVIERSLLGIKIDGVDLGERATLGTAAPYKIDEKYPYRGVHSEAVNRCNGSKVAVKHAKGTSYTLDIRVFDDAAAFRFVVPGTG